MAWMRAVTGSWNNVKQSQAYKMVCWHKTQKKSDREVVNKLSTLIKFGTWVLRASWVECWLIPLIDNPWTPRLTLYQHLSHQLVEVKLIFNWFMSRSTLNWLSTKCWSRVRVRTGHGKPGKSCNLIAGPWKSWKIKVRFDRLFTADEKTRTL